MRPSAGDMGHGRPLEKCLIWDGRYQLMSFTSYSDDGKVFVGIACDADLVVLG